MQGHEKAGQLLAELSPQLTSEQKAEAERGIQFFSEDLKRHTPTEKLRSQ